MRCIFTAVITLITLAFGCGADIPTQQDVRQWEVELMSEAGAILRQCVPYDDWHTSEYTDTDTQQALADLEVGRQLGQTAFDLGVEVEVDRYGYYSMNFEEEVADDVWRALWPEVRAIQEVMERNLAGLREKAREVGCD